MALRKPLVIVNGEIQQLQSGDNLDGQDLVLQRTFTSTALIGQALYADGAGSVDLARANATGTSDVIGMASEAVTSAATGGVQLEGILELTTAQWDAITGDTGGLTVGSKYWLDPSTAGDITATAPTTVGDYVVEVGEGLSTTEMNVRIRRRILL